MSKGGQTTTSSSQPPAWLQTELQNLGTAGQNLASQPLQQYSGPMVAGFTPDQYSAFSTINNAQGIAQPFINSGAQVLGNATNSVTGSVKPYLDTASGYYGSAGNTNVSNAVSPYLSAATSSFSPSGISQFESPYTNDVVNATKNLFNQENQQQQQGVISSAINAGAFGGDRGSVAQALTTQAQQIAQAPVLAGLENTGFQTALQAAGQNAGINLGAASAAGTAAAQTGNLGLQAGQGLTGIGSTLLGGNEAQGWLNSSVGNSLANLGALSQNSALTGANAQLGTGALQQQLAQEQLNIPYEQFLQQQAYPFQTLNWLGGLETGTAGSAGGTSSTTSPGPSTLSQLGGLALTAAAFLNTGGRIQKKGGGGGVVDVPDPSKDLSYMLMTNEPISRGTSIPNPPAPSQQSNTSSSLGSLGLAAALLMANRGGKIQKKDVGGGVIGVPDISQAYSFLAPKSSAFSRGIGTPPPPAAYKQPDLTSQLTSGMGAKALKEAGNSSIGDAAKKFMWSRFGAPDSGASAKSLASQAALADSEINAGANNAGIDALNIDLSSMIPEIGTAYSASAFPQLRKGGVVPHRAPGGSTPDYADEVAQDYQNIVGRAGDQSGIQFYVDQLQNGATPQQVQAWMANSPESQENIAKLYGQSLGRSPDAAGKSFYTNALSTGTPISQIGKYIQSSPEALAHPFTNFNQSGGGAWIPQVSSSLFNMPSANVKNMQSGQFGLGNAFNPLAQYQPPGTNTSDNVVTFPHTTVPSQINFSSGYSPINFANFAGRYGYRKGGVIPHRDDGGDISANDNSVPNPNWRVANLPDTPAYQPAQVPQFGNTHVDPWMALATAGLSMMAGTSPFAGVNIGRGALAGLQEYSQEKAQAQQAQEKQFDVEQKAKDLADRAEQWRAQNAISKENAAEAVARDAANAQNQQTTQAETAVHNRATESYNTGMLKVQQQNAATSAAPSITDFTSGMGIDPATGKTVAGAWTLDNNNKPQFVPGMVLTKPGTGEQSPFSGIDISGKTGTALLNSLPPAAAARITAMIEGREPAPTGAALRDPKVSEMVSLAHQIDPNFDEVSWGARAALYKSFLGGGQGSKDIGSPIQAINHLDELDTNLKALPNVSLGPLTKGANWVANTWAENSDNPAVTNAKRSALAVSDELGKSWHGAGAVPESQVKAWSDAIPINGGPQTKADVAPKTIDLMDGQFDKMRNTWQSTFGPNIPMPPQLTQATQEKYDRLSRGQGRYVSKPLPVANGQPDFASMRVGDVYRTANGYAQYTGKPQSPFQLLNQ